MNLTLIRIFVIAFVILNILAEQVMQPAVAITPHGNRLLGISVNEVPGANYASSFSTAQQIGLQAVSLSLPWDEIEKKPGVYSNKFLSIANQFYPSHRTLISLVITPIDTNKLHLPKDLIGKRFDDPIVINRFNK